MPYLLPTEMQFKRKIINSKKEGILVMQAEWQS
jgi:hypothetical protein